MNAQKTKERVITAAAVIGILVADMALWDMMSAVMWACSRAGIPM